MVPGEGDSVVKFFGLLALPVYIDEDPDPELTCLVCRQRRCDLVVDINSPPYRILSGLHSRCFRQTKGYLRMPFQLQEDVDLPRPCPACSGTQLAPLTDGSSRLVPCSDCRDGTVPTWKGKDCGR